LQALLCQRRSEHVPEQSLLARRVVASDDCGRMQREPAARNALRQADRGHCSAGSCTRDSQLAGGHAGTGKVVGDIQVPSGELTDWDLLK